MTLYIIVYGDEKTDDLFWTPGSAYYHIQTASKFGRFRKFKYIVEIDNYMIYFNNHRITEAYYVYSCQNNSIKGVFPSNASIISYANKNKLQIGIDINIKKLTTPQGRYNKRYNVRL